MQTEPVVGVSRAASHSNQFERDIPRNRGVRVGELEAQSPASCIFEREAEVGVGILAELRAHIFTVEVQRHLGGHFVQSVALAGKQICREVKLGAQGVTAAETHQLFVIHQETPLSRGISKLEAAVFPGEMHTIGIIGKGCQESGNV